MAKKIMTRSQSNPFLSRVCHQQLHCLPQNTRNRRSEVLHIHIFMLPRFVIHNKNHIKWFGPPPPPHTHTHTERERLLQIFGHPLNACLARYLHIPYKSAYLHRYSAVAAKIELGAVSKPYPTVPNSTTKCAWHNMHKTHINQAMVKRLNNDIWLVWVNEVYDVVLTFNWS